MTSYEVRMATPEDVQRWFCGKRPPYSVRAMVVEMEGNIEAFCGILSVNGCVTCFSTLSAKCRENKRAVVAGIRLLRNMLKDYPYVVAYASEDEPTADAFIRHVGFKRIGKSVGGEVYCYE